MDEAVPYAYLASAAEVDAALMRLDGQVGESGDLWVLRVHWLQVQERDTLDHRV